MRRTASLLGMLLQMPRSGLPALAATGLLALAQAHAQLPPEPAAPTVRVQLPPDASPGSDAGATIGDNASALAEKLQNPIGELISVPFQNNINFNVGPHAGTQDTLNIQPVIPIHLNEDWNLITRTILPLV